MEFFRKEKQPLWNFLSSTTVCYIWKAWCSFSSHQVRVSPIEMVRNDWLDMVHTFKRIVEWFYLGFRMLQLVSLKFIYLWLHLFLKKMVSFLVFSATKMVVPFIATWQWFEHNSKEISTIYIQLLLILKSSHKLRSIIQYTIRSCCLLWICSNYGDVFLNISLI